VIDERPFFRVLPAVIALRIAIYAFTFVFWRMTQGGEPGFFLTMVKLWSRWDVEHYLQIAEHGYVDSGAAAGNIAFFPLYPALVSLFAHVVPFVPTVFVAMFVSNAASLLGLWYLHRLTARRWDGVVADRAVLYVSLFPTAYFFLAAYSEGLFFLCVAAAFFYLDEEKWIAAAIAGACASATRLSGALVAIAWLVHFVRRRGWKPSLALWPLVVAPAGLFVYLAINRIVTGDAFRFLEVQRTVWHHAPATPVRGLVVTLRYLAAPNRDLGLWWYRDFMELVAALAGYAGAIVVWRRIGLIEGIYCLGSVILWTSNDWWMSGPRFCLVLFPLFMYVASRALPRAVHHALWAVGVVAQVSFASAFIMGHWAF
jgi:Gpi18-like mannosyltransferase